ncbi:hypothetical protein [Nocardioides sp. cx-173]|uniref:hypothetical protein n=1 Tax=Nocardioides sp. cx-173 TaxID=2898796 RepID=UPI001E567ADB|nr:hypothetical protein [Nocardioides sp. cx-173]MCD4526180.1 hypothetical protein [Nocardioides sp. cx-173]UGB40605.1 hypothetical protein LQ940_14625 [Nocardioides sp. cx-173]
MTLALALAASAAGCSGDDKPEEDPGAAAEAGRDERPPLATTARLGEVVGRLDRPQQARLKATITEVVDAWIDAAYLGDFPRTDFADAFPGFTKGAAADARQDAALMSNQQVAPRVESVTPFRRELEIDALAVKRRPTAVTARFVLAMRLEGELKRADRVRGRLFLTWRDGAWKVFGYDVTRGVVR